MEEMKVVANEELIELVRTIFESTVLLQRNVEIILRLAVESDLSTLKIRCSNFSIVSIVPINGILLERVTGTTDPCRLEVSPCVAHHDLGWVRCLIIRHWSLG